MKDDRQHSWTNRVAGVTLRRDPWWAMTSKLGLSTATSTSGILSGSAKLTSVNARMFFSLYGTPRIVLKKKSSQNKFPVTRLRAHGGRLVQCHCTFLKIANYYSTMMPGNHGLIPAKT